MSPTLRRLIAGLLLLPAAAHAQDEEAADAAVVEEDAGAALNLYLAAERARVTLDLSQAPLVASFGGERFDSDFWRLRAGWRAFEAMALELQAGVADSDGTAAGEVEVSEYYNVSLVPTGVLAELLEVSARIGYAGMEFQRGSARYRSEGMSYGLAAELPLRRLGESLPDLRLTAGLNMYREETKGRAYGFHYGLRYDFGL